MHMLFIFRATAFSLVEPYHLTKQYTKKSPEPRAIGSGL